MFRLKTALLWIFLLLVFHSIATLNLSAIDISALNLIEEFKLTGYAEICDEDHEAATFDSLYATFDTFITFLEMNPLWAQKLYTAKERFIRSKEKDYYSTDFFGFYDESKREGRHQISFYYSTHFHEFICHHYPEFNKIFEISHFLKSCLEIQKPCGSLFEKAAANLGLQAIFFSEYSTPPVLLKVIKYLPCYAASKPHYDGTALSLFLDSTDNQSLFLAPYKSSYSVNDFSAAPRRIAEQDNRHSILLIPGMLLTEFSLYPTPHIVTKSGKTRYATIAFAMRPYHIFQKIELSPLPYFSY